MHKYYNIRYSKFRIQMKRIQIIENIQDYSNFGQNLKNIYCCNNITYALSILL